MADNCNDRVAPSIIPPKDESELEQMLSDMGLMLSPVVIQDAEGNDVTIYAIVAKPSGGATVCDAIVCESSVACSDTTVCNAVVCESGVACEEA